MSALTSLGVRARRTALVLTSATLLCVLGQPPTQADDRATVTTASAEQSGQRSSRPAELRRQAAVLERRLYGLEVAFREAVTRVAQLTEHTAGLAEQADRAAVEADALYARAMARDSDMIQALVDLVRRRESDVDQAMAAVEVQRQAEDLVSVAVDELTTARTEAARAETAWSTVVAEIAQVENQISAHAVARLTMAQAEFPAAYRADSDAQDNRNRSALERWQHYLRSLADTGLLPPPARELEKPERLTRPLRPLRDPAGRATPGLARVRGQGRPALTVLPSETVTAVSEVFSRIGRPAAADPAAYACGGLLSQVWESAGVRVPRHPVEQWRTLQGVKRGAVQVGDAVFSGADEDGVRRAGVYVGDGQMVLADPATGTVSVQPMFTDGEYGVRRVPLPRRERSTSTTRRTGVVADCGAQPAIDQVQALVAQGSILQWATDQLGTWTPPPAPGPAPMPVPMPVPVPTPPDGTGPTVPSRGEFTLASFNVLGDSHTVPGGNRPGWADSGTRMRWAVELLGQHGADVVGFQEFQPPQARNFLSMTGGRWGIYSTPHNTQNAVAWDKDRFTLVSGRTVGIPYFNGRIEQMPVVRLRSTSSGREFHLANFHNPASNARHPGNEKWRDEATRREMALVEDLRRTGLPVLITGDMNERDEFFCRFTASGVMHAAAGGSNGDRCEAPRNAGVDWIFGSDDVVFSGYTLDRSALVRRATDHPLVVSEVTLAPAP